MGTEYRYALLKGSRKHLCPGCEQKRFVPYIDTVTGQLLPEQYGRCDREIKCAYYLNPYIDGYAKNIQDQECGQVTSNWEPKPYSQKQVQTLITPPRKPTYFPVEVFKQSCSSYESNNFVLWLNHRFDKQTADSLISRYHIGTSRHWPGATVFWQIDLAGNIRSGKVMLYDPDSGKRVKEPFNHITWAHKAFKISEYELQQCFFGTHLLRNDLKPIGLVESEKTALICSVYLPELTWLAVGGISNLKAECCQVLAGRKVFLFPDLNAFEKWNAKANKLSIAMPGTTFQVSGLLEQHATESERGNGLDLADYLLRFDYKDFNRSKLVLPAENIKFLSQAGGEKSEKSEALKTNYFLHESPIGNQAISTLLGN